MDKGTILLVEDYKPTADVIIDLLRDFYPEIKVQRASTPAEAETELKKKPFAAVITDDGFRIDESHEDDTSALEMIKKLRAGELGAANADIPVLGLYSFKDMQKMLAAAGATECVDKHIGKDIAEFIRKYNLAPEESVVGVSQPLAGVVHDR